MSDLNIQKLLRSQKFMNKHNMTRKLILYKFTERHYNNLLYLIPYIYKTLWFSLAHILF